MYRQSEKMEWTTSFVNREHTNNKLIDEANKLIDEEGARKSEQEYSKEREEPHHITHHALNERHEDTGGSEVCQQIHQPDAQ